MNSKKRPQDTKPHCLGARLGRLIIFFCLFASTAPTVNAAEVSVYPWQNLEDMVNSYPGGTTFVIKTGVHRMQYAVPKSYDSFIGESGAVMNGAQHLTSFSQSGSYWVAHVYASSKTSDSSLCESTHPGCDFPEQLFFDDGAKIRVLYLSQVGPGKWYLDYSTGEVYMGDDPSGHNVEISLVGYAFAGSATNVKISQLVIEKYASPRDQGAVDGESPSGPLSQHWTVEWNDIRLNHGAGVRIGDYMWVYHNQIYNNGQLGLGGTGKNAVIQNNAIYYNDLAGYLYKVAGGTKFVRCYNLTIQYNNVHNNNGPGLWVDIDNDYVLMEYNTTSYNLVAGIFVEISYHVTVRYNNSQHDGYNPQGSSLWWGAGILNNSSPYVSVYSNTVMYCTNGIGAIQADRGTGAYGPYLVEYFVVHNNSITQVNGVAEGIVKASNYDDSVYTSWHNDFYSDLYYLTYPTTHDYFYWLDEYHTLAWWDEYASLR